MTDVVGEGILKIVVDDSGVDFNRVGQDAAKGGTDAGGKFSKGFLGSMKGLALSAGAAFAAVGVGSFVKSAITGASDMQETIGKTGVVFGKAGQDIIDFASTGAAALGLSKQAALDAAGTFGVFGKAAGLTGGPLTKFSTDLTSLSVDLASFHNAEPEEVIEALGAALRGETEPMRKFGVLLDDVSLREEALRQGLIKTTKDALTPQQKTLAAQALIMRQTADAQGDFARTSGGLANQQRILSAGWKDLTAQIGAAFLPIALAAVKGINSLMSQADKLRPAIDKVGGAFASLFAGGGGESLFGGLADQAKALLPVLLSVAQQIGASLGPVFEAVGAAARDVLPDIITYITTLASAAGELGGFIAANLLPVFADVANIIATQVIPAVAEVYGFLYGQLLPVIIQVATEVASRLAPIFTTLATTFQTQILPAVANAVATFRNDLLPVLEPIILKVVQVVGVLARFAATVLGKVLPPVIRFAGFIIANVVPAIVKLVVIAAKMISTAIQFGAAIGRAVASVVRFAVNMQTTVARAVGSVVTAIAGLPGKVLGFVGKMLSAGKSLIGALFRGIVSAAKGAGGFVSDLAGSILSAVKGAINDALNLPLEVSLPKVLGGKSFTIIPRFADGTLAAPGGLSWVGERGPELIDLPRGTRVYTASQSAGMMNRSSGDGIDVVALAAAIAAAIAPLVRPVTVQTPASDPEAVAMAVANRLVSMTG